jgi:hypothetical protein
MRTALLSAVAALCSQAPIRSPVLHNVTTTPIGHQTEMGIACITGETATNDRRTGSTPGPTPSSDGH